MDIEYLKKIEEIIKNRPMPTFQNIKDEINDPITEEVCEAYLQHYIENGNFNSRQVKNKVEKNRGNDLLSYSFIKHDNSIRSNLEAMNHALWIVINGLKKGQYYIINKVNNKYRKDIIYNSNLLYDYLVTGVADDKIKDLLFRIYNDCYSIESMYKSDQINTDFLNPSVGAVDFRFYINMPLNEETILFCRDYQILCQSFEIPFTMKEFKNIATPGKDVTIFYSSLEELPIKISILRELIKIYPNMELGSVPIACASIKDLPFIGLCNNGICSLLTNGTMKNIRTYNDMISNIFESVLDHFISSYILNSSEFSEKTKIKFSEFKKNGIVNNSRKEMFGALIYYTIHLNQEEKSQIQNYLQTMMQDSLRKKIIIDFFMKNVRIAYNVNNGFSYDYESNIAFDSWYINKKLVAKENINVFHMNL